MIKISQEYIHKNRLGHVTSLVTIRVFIIGTGKFPIQKCAIFRKFKEIGGIARRQTVLYATQAIPSIDAEIAEKGHLWMETP
ncbi:MAG: hypothetical protein WBM78_26195 [Desulfobacterales bacterium]